jgi:hypothetical protein
MTGGGGTVTGGALWQAVRRARPVKARKDRQRMGILGKIREREHTPSGL